MTDDRIDKLIELVQRLEIEAAEARTHREEQQRNIERFWSKDWADLVTKIDFVAREQGHLEVRLRNVEMLLAHTPERISKLEGKCETIEKRLQSMSISIVIIGVLALGQAGAKIAPYF